jgi:hypothetical protein
MYNLKDYIVVLKNIVPDELCDAVLAEYSASDEWGETAVGMGSPIKKYVTAILFKCHNHL